MSVFFDRLLELKGRSSVDEFVARWGISKSTYNSYRTGAVPSIEKAARLADAFDVSLDWLVGRVAERDSTASSGRPQGLTHSETALRTAVELVIERQMWKTRSPAQLAEIVSLMCIIVDSGKQRDLNAIFNLATEDLAQRSGHGSEPSVEGPDSSRSETET